MILSLLALALTAPVVAHPDARVPSLDNGLVRLSYDLDQGVWRLADVRSGQPLLTGASTRCGEWSSTAAGAVATCRLEATSDALGLGRSLLVSTALPGGPTLLTRLTLYPQAGFVALGAGLDNTTSQTVQLKTYTPLADGVAFPGVELATRYSVLDGTGGGQKTTVTHTPGKRTSLNNILATGGAPTRAAVLGGLAYAEFEKYATVTREAAGLRVGVEARDPIGKRIDAGGRYLVEGDRFYLDLCTDNPFEALEAYAERLRLAQHVVLPVCRFPIVDTWFAQVPHFGGGEDRAGYRARNDSVGAVEEAEAIARSGFLKYAPAAVLLEPDLYDPLNQQGWWDDEHWARGPSNRAKGVGAWVSSHGQFVPPYETARQWAGAVRALGCLPMIYVQTGFRSQDYAEQHPEQMIFGVADAPHLNDKGEQQYRDKDKQIPRKLGYDYTNPEFIAHLRDVWERLRLAGIAGVKFDYPDFPFTGWPTRGGLADPYATTAMHYRNIFRLAAEGLGPDCYLHERTLDRGSDITLGLVASQRTEGDTDRLEPFMVARNALRWYKNRVVVCYDLDGKNVFHAQPANRDGERAMLTMTYLVGGTLMVVPSFGRLSAEQLYELSRLYPFHSERRSARPLDLFDNAVPQVYDFRVEADWHVVTYWNPDPLKPATVSAALGLDGQRRWWVYDFWNDRLVGQLDGGERLSQELRPGEARVMAVRAARPEPQVLSTNRHLLQGVVDLRGTHWEAGRQELRGTALVVGGETYKLVLATNGLTAVSATVDDSLERSLSHSARPTGAGPASAQLRPVGGHPELVALELTRPDNGPVAWRVMFERRH